MDRVPWTRLHHAYGAAADVPGLLRALAAGDEEEREEALYELYGNIYHQGTVYEATAYAVPFLIELLEVPGIRGKADLLLLLRALATGSSYREVHQGIVFAGERETPEFAAELAREQEWVRATRAAVVAGTPVYLRLLGDEEPALRRAAPYLLAECGTRREAVVPALAARLAAETDPPAKASQVLALSRLVRDAPGVERSSLAQGRLPQLAHSADEAPVVRLAAALSLVELRGGGPDLDLLPVLREVLPEALDDLGAVPWSDGRPLWMIAEVLAEHPDLRVQPLLDMARHPDPQRRWAAIDALEDECRRGRPAPRLAAPLFGEALSDPDPDVRETAARALSVIGQAANVAVMPLAAALEDPRRRVRWYAALALARLGDARAVPTLAAMLAVPGGCHQGLKGLERLGPAGLPAVPRLRNLLRWEPDPQRRIPVLLVLGAVGPVAREAFPDLLRALRHPATAMTAAYVLGLWGPAAQQAVPHLARLLRARDPFARRSAAQALGEIGPAAAAARPLARLMRDRDAWVRANAAFALWQIERRPDAVPVLAAVLREGLGARLQAAQLAVSRAAECLSRIALADPEAPRPAAQALRAALASDNCWVRVHAARALWRIDRRPAEILPVLLEELRGQPAGMLAIECLGEIGPPARAAVPTLQRMAMSERRQLEVGDTDSWVEADEALQAAAARALARVVREA